MRVIARWLAEQGFEDLSDVRDHRLDAFRAYVLGLDRTDGRKADLIGAVRTLWLFRDHMPAQCRLDCDFPWAEQTANEVVGALVKKTRQNKTPAYLGRNHGGPVGLGAGGDRADRPRHP